MKEIESILNQSQHTQSSRRKTGAERMRAFRARKKKTGYKTVIALVPDKYKKMLDQFCSTTGLTIPKFVCYMLNRVNEGKVVEVDEPLEFIP